MSLLSEKELWAIVPNADNLESTRAIEAAILAKLASAELPVTVWVDVPHFTFTAAQLHEAHAQGFAAGAASQLSAEPVAFTDVDFMNIFVSKDIAQDCGATIELYTWRQANDRLHKAD